MQIVIDIPEEVYKKAKETHDVMCDSVWLGIKYGTPLDKIRAEIIDLAEGWNGMQAKNVPLGAVLKVIDKHTSGKKG